MTIVQFLYITITMKLSNARDDDDKDDKENGVEKKTSMTKIWRKMRWQGGAWEGLKWRKVGRTIKHLPTKRSQK